MGWFSWFSSRPPRDPLTDYAKRYDLQMEERIAMETIFMEKRRAMEQAQARHLGAWLSFSGGIFSACLVFLTQKTGQKLWAAGIAPVMSVAVYSFVYSRPETAVLLKEEAGRMLLEEPDAVTLPGGPITLAELDRRIAQKVSNNEGNEGLFDR